MIKDFHFFFKSDKSDSVVQDFETNFLCVIWIQAIFLLNEKLDVSSQFNSLFILYISTAKPFSLLGSVHIISGQLIAPGSTLPRCKV